jgi:predicted Zn-dependent peptidase
MKEVAEKGFPEELIETAKKNILFNVAYASQSVAGYVGTFYNDLFNRKEFLTLKDYKKIFSELTNKNIIEYANWLLEKDSKFICMNK